MMARHTEVGKQSVYPLHAVIAHPVLQIAEVAPHEGEVVLRFHVVFRVGILVETVEMPCISEARQYLAAMTATTEGDVYVYAVRLDVEAVDALVEENRYVVCIYDSCHYFLGLFVSVGGGLG